MKTLIFILIVFFVIVLPTRAELTPEDLDKIRLIVKEEIKKEFSSFEGRIKEYVDIKIGGVDKQFESVDKQFESVDKQITHVTYITYGLIALIVAAIGIPQIIMAWRSEKDQDHAKQIQELRQEIETLKQQQIIRP